MADTIPPSVLKALAAHYEDTMNAKIMAMTNGLTIWVASLVDEFAKPLAEESGENVIPFNPLYFGFEVCRKFTTLADFFERAEDVFRTGKVPIGEMKFHGIYRKNAEVVLKEAVAIYGLKITPQELEDQLRETISKHKDFFWDSILEMPLVDSYRHGSTKAKILSGD